MKDNIFTEWTDSGEMTIYNIVIKGHNSNTNQKMCIKKMLF